MECVHCVLCVLWYSLPLFLPLELFSDSLAHFHRFQHQPNLFYSPEFFFERNSGFMMGEAIDGKGNQHIRAFYVFGLILVFSILTNCFV